MYFYKHEVHRNRDTYEVILYINPQHTLEEFAEEFGLTKQAEEDINRIAVGYVESKLPTLKVKAIKVMMGGILVTTILFSGGLTQAFANEHETTTQTETSTETTDTGTVEAESPTEPTPEEPAADGTTEEEPTADEPSLLPGDFFYFVKTLSEKISLALTFDDIEKAQKLAEFATERIAEANALLEKGDAEGAAATLQKALENQELALGYSEEIANEAGTTEGDGTTDEVNAVRKALEEQFTANTIALLVAMEQVDNPQAREALAKNVEKSFERMSKKLEKIGDIKKKIQEKITKGELNDIEDLEEDIKELQEDIEEDQEEFEEDMEEAEEKSTEAKGTDRDKDDDEEAVEDRGAVVPVVPKKAEEKKKEPKKTEETEEEGEEEEEEARQETPEEKSEEEE